jgi:hypothetical protein
VVVNLEDIQAIIVEVLEQVVVEQVAWVQVMVVLALKILELAVEVLVDSREYLMGILPLVAKEWCLLNINFKVK